MRRRDGDDDSDHGDMKTIVISISACADNQSSMCDIGDQFGFGGSLTVHIDTMLPTWINTLAAAAAAGGGGGGALTTITQDVRRLRTILQPLNQQVCYCSMGTQKKIK